MQSCTSSGVAPYSTFFCKWNILFETQTALIIETDIALDFERRSAVDIGLRNRELRNFCARHLYDEDIIWRWLSSVLRVIEAGEHKDKWSDELMINGRGF